MPTASSATRWNAATTPVYLWKMAVEKAKSFDVDKVIAASSGLAFDAPEGQIRIHATNHHVAKKVRIGRARTDGQFDIVYESADDRAQSVPEAR